MPRILVMRRAPLIGRTGGRAITSVAHRCGSVLAALGWIDTQVRWAGIRPYINGTYWLVAPGAPAHRRGVPS